MKKHTALILLCALLLPAFAACSEKPDSKEKPAETQAAPSAAEAAAEDESEARAYPYYAGHDFQGKKFHFINAPRAYWDMFTTVAAEETTAG